SESRIDRPTGRASRLDHRSKCDAKAGWNPAYHDARGRPLTRAACAFLGAPGQSWFLEPEAPMHRISAWLLAALLAAPAALVPFGAHAAGTRVVFHGLRHEAIGAATLARGATSLTVRGIGSSGEDGVRIPLPAGPTRLRVDLVVPEEDP